MNRLDDISASLEDYLEIIYILEKENNAARAKDIADRMKVQKASVTGALRALSAKGLINYEPYSVITLTDRGKEIAREIIRRHEILKEFFELVLKLPPEEAEENACKIEHVIHIRAMKKLTKFLEFLKLCPRAGLDWFDAFENYCKQNPREEECLACIKQCMEKQLYS